MEIILKSSGNRPIYEQIVSQMKAMILRGELKAGDGLPSMRKLAKDLHVSLITTQRAYEDLQREGYIHTVTGKGTFVAFQDLAHIREGLLEKAEEELREAVRLADEAGAGKEELMQILQRLYAEG